MHSTERYPQIAVGMKYRARSTPTSSIRSELTATLYAFNSLAGQRLGAPKSDQSVRYVT